MDICGSWVEFQVLFGTIWHPDRGIMRKKYTKKGLRVKISASQASCQLRHGEFTVAQREFGVHFSAFDEIHEKVEGPNLAASVATPQPPESVSSQVTCVAMEWPSFWEQFQVATGNTELDCVLMLVPKVSYQCY